MGSWISGARSECINLLIYSALSRDIPTFGRPLKHSILCSISKPSAINLFCYSELCIQIPIWIPPRPPRKAYTNNLSPLPWTSAFFSLFLISFQTSYLLTLNFFYLLTFLISFQTSLIFFSLRLPPAQYNWQITPGSLLISFNCYFLIFYHLIVTFLSFNCYFFISFNCFFFILFNFNPPGADVPPNWEWESRLQQHQDRPGQGRGAREAAHEVQGRHGPREGGPQHGLGEPLRT